MIDFDSVLAFSHTYCVSICAVLVPFNLLTTILTLVLVALNRPKAQIWQSCSFASLGALLMVLHVVSWFLVGVVRGPTFVLLALGSICLATNCWALLHSPSLQRLLLNLAGWGRRSLKLLRPGMVSS